MKEKYIHQYRFAFLARFILYFMSSAAAVLATVISLDYQKFNFQQSKSLNQESLRLTLVFKIMQKDLSEAIEDIRTVASLQIVHNFAITPNSANRQSLENSLLNFANIAREYDQIRFLDKTGMERVRVNFDGRTHTAVTEDQLQDKSLRYYFREALSLKRNAVYISPLDLNVEKEQVELPLKPIIRLLSPVIDDHGYLQGMMVLNYLADNLLNNFRAFMTGSWGSPMLVNPNGYWLSNPDRKAEWGFMFGSKQTFKGRYVEAWDHIVQQESGTVRTADGLFIFNTVRPQSIVDTSGIAFTEKYIAEPFWKIISWVPENELTYQPRMVLKTRYQILLQLLLVVGILTASLAWWRTNYVKEVAALRKSEKHLAEAQRIAHVGNWVLNIREGTLVWSEEIYRIFGLNPEASKPSYNAFIDAVHPDDRVKVKNAIDEAITQNSFYKVNHRILLPDGTTRFMRERGAVQYDSQEKPIRMFGTVQDVTEATLAEHALIASDARYRNLFENMADGYVLQQALFNEKAEPYDYCYLEINPVFERMVGLTREEIIGKTVLKLLPDMDSDCLKVLSNVAVSGQSQRLADCGQYFGRFYECTVSSPEYGLVAVFFADITDRKQAEMKLQDSNKTLEERVAQRTAALEASNKELEKFSYSIAHDLRTPLRAIISFSQILQEEAGPKFTEQERKDLQRVITAGKHMSNLIDDILNLACISRVKFHTSSVNLSMLANSIIKSFEKMQPDRRVRVGIAPNLQCNGDERLLKLVLENLLSNAWKYTASRVDARIDFGETRINDENVYFVRDNGVGFDMKYSHKLFTPFGRLHTPDEFEGTGIGLMSAQSAINRHQGKIWAESRINEGSIFYFTVNFRR